MTPDLRPRGKVWIFGDDVNTDEMYPGFAMRLPVEQAARHMFDATRPDWPGLVGPGDIVVGGRRFGLGSARPVPLLLRELGVRCVLAEEFTSLFLRNCVNHGLPALAIAGVTAAFEEGDVADIDIEEASVLNPRTGARLTGTPYPPFVLDLLRSGGVEADLRERGFLA